MRARPSRKGDQESDLNQWRDGQRKIARPEPIGAGGMPMRRKGETGGNMDDGHAGNGQGDAEDEEVEAGDEAGHGWACILPPVPPSVKPNSALLSLSNSVHVPEPRRRHEAGRSRSVQISLADTEGVARPSGAE